MQKTGTSDNTSILKKFAPYSVIERGIRIVESNSVSECRRDSNLISGVVAVEEGEERVSFRLTASGVSSPSCACCTEEDLQEQWCANLVALFIKADELGLLESLNKSNHLYLINHASSDQVAQVIAELSSMEQKQAVVTKKDQKLKIACEIKHDLILIEILLDNEAQTPDNISTDFSDRALENFLLEVIEEQANWNEELKCWTIDNISSAKLVLGLMREFSNILKLHTNKSLTFAKQNIDAILKIEWKDSIVDLSMYWVFADGHQEIKRSLVFGAESGWTIIDDQIFKLDEQAAKIAILFPQSGSITLSRTQAGPILEALMDEMYDRNHIEIINPDKQPKAEIKTPEPLLTLERTDSRNDHFSSASSIEINAELNFRYPEPPNNKNVIYLPNRSQEQEFKRELEQLGFAEQSGRYRLRSDDALQFINAETALCNKWTLEGYKEIKKTVKCSELMLVIELKSIKDEPLLECKISLLQNSSNVPLSILFKNNYDDSTRWIRLDNGSFAKVPLVTIGALNTTLGMITSNFRFAAALNVKITQAQAISLARIEDPNVRIKTDAEVKELARKLRDFAGIKAVKATKEFVGKLRPYQAEGLSWLSFLNEFGLDGILADEMGLGKTVQALALIQKLKNSKKIDKPALIVAPTSVITNWSYECKKFTPDLKCALLHGAQRKSLLAKIPEYDVVITSYTLLRMDRAELEKQHFSYLILDEAQNIKNPQAITSRAAKALKADRRLALSGTPTENRPLELWSIMDFLMPGYLGAIDFFRNQIERPIMEHGTNTQIAHFLNSKTRPFILRRLKRDVEKDLPPKIESELHVAMTASQKQLYNQILEEVRPKVFDAIEKKGIGGASVSILAALLRLRQVCNHPNSIDSLKDLDGFDSGKFRCLQDLVLEALANNRKILLFSQFREMLSIIRNWLDEQDVKHLYLDGTTKDRQGLVDRFNSDSSIRLFLISLKAGGTGLNLTGADTVIIYDPWWNPAVETQAIDRAHRIGQFKAVSVYRLITENSIEQKIMDLKARKSQLIDALINENGLSSLKLSKKDLESFFSPLPADGI